MCSVSFALYFCFFTDLFLCHVLFFFFFFFQAEDGIRDGRVTGVQTCALPICSAFLRRFLTASAAQTRNSTFRNPRAFNARTNAKNCSPEMSDSANFSRRSEERRVGKECRSRGEPNHEKKKRTKQINRKSI